MRLAFLVVILTVSLLVPRAVPAVQVAEPSSIDTRSGTPIPENVRLLLTRGQRAGLREMLGRNWVVFGGFLLCVTIQAGSWSDYLIASPGTGGLTPQDSLHIMLGLALGAFALLLAARLLKDLTALYLIAPLVCVASLVVMWFFGDQRLSFQLFSLLPFGLSLAVFGILHVTRLSRELDKGLSLPLVAGPFVAFTLLLLPLRFVVYPLIGFAEASVVDLICMVVFLVAVSAQSIVSAQRRSAIATKAANRPLADICAEVSDGFSLSPRESEVLVYLVQGRSASYIAEQQFVAISTIKTHIQRIFRKTGVHSKQELLDLVYKLDA